MSNKAKDRELSHSMVHYLLTIHKLKESKGYARVTDIAKDLNLTKGSVSTAISNLKKKGLIVEEEDSKFLNLSKLGHTEVHNVLSTRTLLFYFLRDFIGVTEEVAQKDSCLMEHLMSDESREKFFKFMKTLSCQNDDCEKEFHSYSTSLNLCNYENASQFFENQKGDSYLI